MANATRSKRPGPIRTSPEARTKDILNINILYARISGLWMILASRLVDDSVSRCHARARVVYDTAQRVPWLIEPPGQYRAIVARLLCGKDRA